MSAVLAVERRSSNVALGLAGLTLRREIHHRMTKTRGIASASLRERFEFRVLAVDDFE
jgi:hypothetical protein